MGWNVTPCGFKILTKALSAAIVSKLRVSHIAVIHTCTMYIPSDMYLGTLKYLINEYTH